MKVLVTGGAGYLGAVLVPELIAHGHDVTVLDNFMYGQNSLAACCASPHFEVVRSDARDSRHVEPLLRRADAIVPLAAIVGAPACARDETAARSINAEAIAMLCKLKSRQQIVVFPNTNSGYGAGLDDGLCVETTPMEPISLYGQTKCLAEQYVLETNGIALRLATVFGMSPRMRLDLMVNDFTWRAVTDRSLTLFESRFRRNFVHIHDVASAFLWALDGRLKFGNAYNAGNTELNMTKRQLCEAIARQVPGFLFADAPIGEDPDKRDYLVSNAKIEALGWRADYSLEQGIAELVKGYRMLRNSRYGNV